MLMPYSIGQHRTEPGLSRGPDPDRDWYSNRRWRRLRAMVLREHPLCADPFGCHGGRTVPAVDVDHVLPRRQRPDLTFVKTNLRALCKACHGRVTRDGEA
jgi:5-methylcytosine-specific restriction endonuclease McrA